ncbi:MAG: Rab family GTPase [Promethearchaeota archaeon]|jgi:small GTP-binding protein
MGSKRPFYKICIVGDYGVGKSTLLHRYLERRFITNLESTIGSNFFMKQLKIPNFDNYVSLQIWDLAGQDHFKWVRQAFYKGAHGIVYVFDLTRKETCEHILNWKEEIENISGRLPNILVGNKLDLINPQNQSTLGEKIDFLKQTTGACFYNETSAKIGTGVDDIFYNLTLEMYKKFRR